MAQGPYQHYNTNPYDDDEADADYAPRSPNLNPQFQNYESDPLPVHPQHQSFRASVSHISPFSPTGNADYFGRGLSLQQSPYALQQHNNQRNPYAQQQQQPQVQALQQQQQFYQQQQYQQQQQHPYSQIKAEMDEHYGAPSATAKRGRGRGKKVKEEDADADYSEEYAGGGGDDSAAIESASNGIEVKTKFPVARIKRIMQADEDVGKVAQVTPVAVSKALELFMISLITKSAHQAKQRGSKRVAPHHLKAAIAAEEQFDFLNEIVSKVPDAPPPGTSSSSAGAGNASSKHEMMDSDGGEDNEAVTTTKRKVSSRGRKRRDA